MERTGRNEPCYCGSGKKYKHCCGKLFQEEANASLPDGLMSPPKVDVAELKKKAVEKHENGELIQAVALYEQLMRHFPEDFDVLHMLGVAKCQLGQNVEGLELLLKAVSVQTEDCLPLYQNLGRVIENMANENRLIEKLLCPDLVGLDKPVLLAKGQLVGMSNPLPRVSVVVPIYNHEKYVVEAIRSVYAQTYPNIEIILIDDGSTDQSAALVKEVIPDSPYPIVFRSRENKGAHATLNEAIELAEGDFIGVLNSDDRYLSDRVESLVRLLLATGRAWCFSGLGFIDDKGNGILRGQNPHADMLMEGLSQLDSDESVTIGFANFNYAITTGNLFFSKSIWKRLGGFSGYRYVHDWDFCLRALEIESPAILREETYEYRLHETNTISETGVKVKMEALGMLGNWAKASTQDNVDNLIRHQLICCAQKRLLLVTRNAHLLGKDHLIMLANKLLSNMA